jgi:hypothetical protein
MGAQNTTPDTSTYVLGRGKMYFSEIGTDGLPKGDFFVGNVPEVTATVESENYEHFRSTQGLRTKDLDIIIQQSINWTAALENMNKENLAIFFSAVEDTTFINPAITGFAGTTLVADGNMVSAATGGLWYQLVDADNEPATGITATNNIDLQSTNATPVTLTEDTDYIVDNETGRVFFLDTAPIQTIISGSEGVTATLTADATLTNRETSKLEAGTKGETNVAIRFEQINAQTDAVELIYFLHKAGVTSNGDAGLISDEVAQLPISIAVEQNDAYNAPMTIIDLRG